MRIERAELLPKRRKSGYGETQRIIEEFKESDEECVEVLDYDCKPKSCYNKFRLFIERNPQYKVRTTIRKKDEETHVYLVKEDMKDD